MSLAKSSGPPPSRANVANDSSQTPPTPQTLHFFRLLPPFQRRRRKNETLLLLAPCVQRKIQQAFLQMDSFPSDCLPGSNSACLTQTQTQTPSHHRSLPEDCSHLVVYLSWLAGIPGRVDILEAVDTVGTLSAALGIYRRLDQWVR